MNEITATTATTQLEAAELSTSATAAQRLQRPRAVKIILPVWGFRFVRQFLEFTLPTLLAPGNVPALARALPCQFVVLTGAQDEDVIREHRAWRRLGKICRADIELIDDLITDGNHSTTLTLAYARAIRLTGEQMLDTCFMLLVSDYIVADGSLRHVLARMENGASGVLAGNFQVIAEEAIPLLRRKLTSISPELVLPSRDLVQWTFNHLHPTTTASIVNYPLNHKVHTNRLFWRVDDGTLIGRFYLLHPIAVRPEVTDFVVGSSFDYSFIPEMCPSNNVEVITDSDDYLVVEMQPREHEAKQVRWGPIDPRELAKSLSEWATARHRENVQYTLAFHTSDIPAEMSDVANQANEFIEEVTRNLPPAAQPYRNHYYWIGAIAAHRAQTGQILTAADWQFLLGEASGEQSWLIALLCRCRVAFFGTPPDVRPWHPRWPDYRPALDTLARMVHPDSELILVAQDPRYFAPWLARCPYNATTVEIGRLLNFSRRQYMPFVGKFDCCLMFLREGDLSLSDELLKRIGPLLKPGGHALISAANDQPADPRNFAESFAYHSGRFVNLPLWLKKIQYVPASRLRWNVQHRLRWNVQQLTERLSRGASARPIYQFPLLATAAAGTAFLSYLCNLRALQTSSEPQGKACSSVFVVLNSSANGTNMRLPEFKLEKQSAHGPFPVAKARASSGGKIQSDAEDREMLGAKSNQIWRGDPRRLAFELARYRFVGSLLSGRHDVGEYGCGDAFGTRLVLQEVRKVTVYDSDPDLVDDVRRRRREQWALEAHVHDILQDRLPHGHDSIFSLRTLERIGPEQEERFAQHLRDSLVRDHDVMIIGSSAPELPADTDDLDTDDLATGALDAELIHPRSGAMIKALMERYFHSVFVFSMIGETVIAGNVPGAHYFFALCCSKKG